MSENVSKAPIALISLFAQRIEKLDQNLNRNILFQVILVALSLYSFQLDGKPLQQFSAKNLGFDPESRAVEGLIVISLIYLFVRFGFLAATFLSLRLSANDLTKKLLINSDINEVGIRRLFNTGNPLDLILTRPSESRLLWGFFSLFGLILFAVLVALNNCCILLYTHRVIDPPYRFPVLIGELVVLIPFYLTFAKSRMPGVHVLLPAASLLTPVISIVLYLELIGGFKAI
jgi:hypothetical protein